MRNKLIIALLSFTFTGCVSTTLTQEQLLAVSDTKPSQTQNEIAEPVIRAAIDDANLTCSEVIGSRETLAEKRSKKSLWISLGGLIAGSVVAPALTSANAAANAPWIAAFSGAGGAANMASRAVDDAGFSGAADAQTVNSISEKVKEKMVIALQENSGPKARYEAAIAAKVECLYYPRYVYKLPSPEAGAGAGAGAGAPAPKAGVAK
ncbi:hypothetical protein HX859_13120 [Pseudomonas gingeri]|uniref:hypothetical protein n=1 Tax=Pseudomonas gingeri TaxID=117681 RepID=UPI0015A09278|nr:hypothetical protein [Pseudomonas gingeri]NVZ75825.1 hypothetical protein [Pseudomonas gingeri]